MTSPNLQAQDLNLDQLAQDIKRWGRELGFQQVGICDTDLGEAEQRLQEWLDKGYHGELDYMARYGAMRARPHELVPGTVRVISVRMDYLPPNARIKEILGNPLKGLVSRYALGRDYHKVIRKRLQQLGDQIEKVVGPHSYRVFTDSAPIMEKPLAVKAGLGWIGKHTNVINKKAGSWFFIGEILTDIPLPIDEPATTHCGTCQACIDVCPTKAIVAPFQVDARRCISYLTIELRGTIPHEFRKAMGNHIYGCDDCQLVCPWNKFARATEENDFLPRHELSDGDLVQFFNWTEEEFLHKTTGSAIRRIGYNCWIRNVAVALGNAPSTPEVLSALKAREHFDDEMVREHIQWALDQHIL